MADPSIADAVALPPKEAIAFLRQKTNQTTERWTDVWNEAHSRAFSVAGAASEALVQDFRAAVTKAIEGGTTLAEFRRDFDAIVAKHGWVHNGSAGWRSQIIYETNLSTAYSAGRYAQMTEPDILEAFPYWRYQHNAAVHPRIQHLEWSGLVLRADDPWWGTHYPPNGWRCHCSVSAVSEGGLRRMGRTAPDKAPPIDLQKVRLKVGDGAYREVEVPRGIDPGFGYNPGQAWQQHADRPVVGQMPPRPAAPTSSVPKPPTPAPPARSTSVDATHVHPASDVGPVPVQPAVPHVTHRIPPPAWASETVTVAADYSDWADGLLRTRRPDGSRRVVGALSTPVMQWLDDRQARPKSRALSVTAAQLLHIARDTKAATGRGIDRADLMRLPELLRHPVAVLRETATGELIMVFKPSDPNDERVGQLVVQLGMDTKTRSAGHIARIKINGVKSATLMPWAALNNPGRYELVDGALGK